MSTPPMNVTVNGKPRTIEGSTADGMDLPSFLHAFEINPKLVAVAINGDVIPRSAYDAARVREGDSLEIVRMVGGGAR